MYGLKVRLSFRSTSANRPDELKNITDTKRKLIKQLKVSNRTCQFQLKRKNCLERANNTFKTNMENHNNTTGKYLLIYCNSKM